MFKLFCEIQERKRNFNLQPQSTPPKALIGAVSPSGTVGLWVLKSFSPLSYDVLRVLNKLGRFHHNSRGVHFPFEGRGCEMENADLSTVNKHEFLHVYLQNPSKRAERVTIY